MTPALAFPLPRVRRLHGGRYRLRAHEVAAGFATRAQVFAACGGAAGWVPQP